MKLASFRFTDAAIVFKAPKDMIYIIESVSFTNFSAKNLLCAILDRFVEDPADSTSLPALWEDTIAIFNTGTIDNMYHVTGINHKTKYFTCGKNTTTGCDVMVVIYGQIVKATRIELLLEWFRKAR